MKRVQCNGKKERCNERIQQMMQWKKRIQSKDESDIVVKNDSDSLKSEREM